MCRRVEIMPDMLVNLLKLPAFEPIVRESDGNEIFIRRAQPFEITRVREFIERDFSVAWADEISVGFAGKPVSIYIAVAEKKIVGFAAYECTRRGFFGPTGVADTMQR